MSLATRCPACSTVFRVVQDQLRVSEGWVRCGQCQEVFNALETLFDLEPLGTAEAPAEPPAAPSPPAQPATVPPEAPAPAPAPAFVATQPADALGDPTPAADDLSEWVDGPRPEDHWDQHEATLPMSLEALAASYRTAQAAAEEQPPSAPDAPQAPTTHDDVLIPAPQAVTTPDSTTEGVDIRQPASAAHEDATSDDLDDDEHAPTPSRFIGPVPDWARSASNERRGKKKSRRIANAEATHAQPHVSDKARRRRRKPEFVRQAERAALWRRPLVRAALGGAAALFAAGLLAQVGYQYREPLAARSPLIAPVLQAACARLGCGIGAPRALEHIRLDASDLTRTDEDRVLRFTADLHNTADFAVRTPALDLSFTDATGQLLSRKVLLPAELGARGEAMGAQGQWRVDARLSVGDLRIAGYTVEVFYP